MKNPVIDEINICLTKIKRRIKKSSWRCILFKHKWEDHWVGGRTSLADFKKRKCQRNGCREWETVILKTYG